MTRRRVTLDSLLRRRRPSSRAQRRHLWLHSVDDDPRLPWANSRWITTNLPSGRWFYRGD